MTRAVAVSLVCLLAGTCVETPSQPRDTTLPTGRWTGDGACLSVAVGGCDLVVGCGHGQFRPPAIRADGTFQVSGTFRIEAGPVSINPAPACCVAYSARIVQHTTVRASQLNRATLTKVKSSKPKASIRVLFVDDDSATREGYATYLANCGYDVMPVATGREALALASTWVPNVIVLDLGLPDIDGWEVARQLRAALRTVAIPIIALTASDLPHERASAMRAGCDRHLPKPCVPADLVDVIRLCLEPT